MTWYQRYNFVAPNITIPAIASPGLLTSYGFNDPIGYQWYVNSSAQLVIQNMSNYPWNYQTLTRPQFEAACDSRSRVQFKYMSSAYFNTIHRLSGFPGKAIGYGIGFGQFGGTSLNFFRFNTNNFYSLSSFSPGLVANTPYWLDSQVYQNTTNSTILSCTIYKNDGVTFVYGCSCQDSTTILQNLTGLQGLSYTNTITTVTAYNTFIDKLNQSTAINLYGPPIGYPNNPSYNFTTIVNGSLSSNVIVTPTDSSTGTFSPSSVTLFASVTSVPSATFTYTPPNTGVYNISITNSAGLSTISSTTFFSILSTTQSIPVSSNAFYFSPGNWKGDVGRGGGNWRQTWNIGAYFRFNWIASNSPSIILNVNGGGNTYVGYYLNGIFYNDIQFTGINLNNKIISNSLNTLEIIYNNDLSLSRWNNGTSTVQISGITLDGSSSPIPVSYSNNWVMIVGDEDTSYPSGDWNTDAYSFLVGRQLLNSGYEYCVNSCDYNGWLCYGDSPTDVPAYYSLSGSSNGLGGVYNDSASRWNKIDQGVSLLDSNGQISSFGSTGTIPAAILINLMKNDALSGVSVSDSQASVTQCLSSLRAAAPSTQIIVLAPFTLKNSATYNSTFYAVTYAPTYNQSYYSALYNGVTAYQAAYPQDKGVQFVELGVSSIMGNSNYYINNNTFSIAAHAYVAPMVSAAISRQITGRGVNGSSILGLG